MKLVFSLFALQCMRKPERNTSLSVISEERISIKVNYNQSDQLRIARHEKLIELIRDYSRTTQQQQKLRRLRKNTIMEIDLRFRNSTQNRLYVFPKTVAHDKDDQADQAMNVFSRNCYYDLNSQNQLPKQSSQSEFMHISRRVKSLDQVTGGIRSEKLIRKIGRLQTDLDNEQSVYQKNPHLDKSKAVTKQHPAASQLILPILGKKIENLKTEANQKNSKSKIERIMMKKLVTQAYNPPQLTPKKIYERRAHSKRK